MAGWPATWKTMYQEQLRPGYGDCAPCCVGTWIDMTSGGLVDVGIRTAFGNSAAEMNNIAVDLIQEIRYQGGQHTKVKKGVGMSDAQRLLAIRGGSTGHHWDARFAAVGLNPPKFRAYSSTTFDGAFKTDIIAGRGALVSIMYGPVDWYPLTVEGKADSPTRHTISGQWAFRKGHSLLIQPNSYTTPGGIPTVIIQEPLEDGRYSQSTVAEHGSLTTVVSGPQTVPLSVVKAAAGLYAGTGKVIGGTFTYAAASATADPTVIILITAANPTHITTQAAHGLSTGDTVTIAGSDSTPSINGTWTVTVIDTTHFTIPLAVTGAGANGVWSQEVGGPPPPSDPCHDSSASAASEGAVGGRNL